MLIILINKLLPPYERNGKVTPVTGIIPITTIKFIIDWKIIWKIIPIERYLANWFLLFKAIFIPLHKIIANSPTTMKAPTTPNSSAIIEKIKSVWGSGR